ncbi:lysophospholipase D GDPD1-like [Clytia hemisphaerica]|uniref:GP-PDE domain-containing protein n=1 Tax=Clytia hemisphaerica TaxID=252671 RepID=A0A7M5WIA4_9CNID|eukprot:TCONS_00065587-protein
MLALWITIGVTGTYITASILFGRFPTLLHKKKKQKFRCQHISHRGGAGENLENTITAYKDAIKNGTNMIELDVQLTADGVVVVSHDNELGRITGAEGLISETNFEDLPCLQPVQDITFDIGAKMTSDSKDNKIPTLRKVFEEFPNIPMNIDIKRNDDELIDKTLALIKEFQREEIVAAGNFSETITGKIHQRAPKIPLIFSMKKVMITLVLFYTGLLPFIPLKEDFFEIPLPRVILRHPDTFVNIRTLLKIADWLLVSPVLFRHLQRRGIQVYMFVIQEDEDFDFCLNKAKVDGVMTDYPKRLSNFLKESKGSTGDETDPILKKD